jgi:hypothetical protein
MTDVVSFAQDEISADFLLEHYRALLFAGWNTATERQYETLRRYAEGGGRLFLAIPHLSTNVTRNYSSYGVDELVRNGDFSDLCGARVKGRGSRLYWATAPEGTDTLGFRFPRRFGIVAVPRGEIEIVDPAAEPLVVDDEQAYPLLLRRACGKGEVYFLNSWAYPGAWDADDGPGGVRGSAGLIGAIYRRIATLSRGRVWITDDGKMPGAECEYVAFSCFPRSGQVCLQNVDFDRPHRIALHRDGKRTAVELAPAEFRIIGG